MSIKKTIEVCNLCSSPVVWTLAFDYSEYYCLLCGNKSGMMGGKTDVEETIDLKNSQKIIEVLWKVLRRYLLGSGPFQMSNCKKCVIEDDHRQHLSKQEISKDKIIRNLLKKLSK